MEKRVTPERAISFTKLSVALTCSWPPSPFATSTQILFFNVLWCAGFISSVALLLPLLAAIYEYRKDPVILGKTVCLTSAVSQVAIKMIMCRLHQKQFQILHFEMEHFCKHTTEEGKRILQRYVDKYKYFHGVYVLCCFLTAGFVISGPLYSSQSLPTHAVYPFSVKDQPLKCIIFVHQSLVGFQVSSAMSIDTQTALLLRYAAARFELLSRQFRNAKTASGLDSCIKKHDELLRFQVRQTFLFKMPFESARYLFPFPRYRCPKMRAILFLYVSLSLSHVLAAISASVTDLPHGYTGIIRRSVGLLILATIATTTVAVIFGSLNLIANQPLPVKAVYAIVVFSAGVELFVYVWPADSLTRMSEKPAVAVYNGNWFQRSVAVQKKVLYIIMRSQRVETIQVSGIVPKLTLPYYGKYLYASLSYFTALRIMIGTSTSIEAL